MLKRALGVVAIGAMAALAGCTDPIEAKQDPVRQYPQVSLETYYLQTWTRVQEPQATRVPGGELKVAIPIRNLTDSDMSLDYQYTFTDAKGVAVEDQTGWQYLRLPRKGVGEITFTSLTPVPMDFRVVIREAH